MPTTAGRAVRSTRRSWPAPGRRRSRGPRSSPVEMSYGSHRRIHDAASDYGFIGLPVVIEMVDGPERIDALLAELGPMLAGAAATVQPVRVVRYAHAEPEAKP